MVPYTLCIHLVLFFSLASFSFVPSLSLLSFSFFSSVLLSTRTQASVSSYDDDDPDASVLLAMVVYFQTRHIIHERLSKIFLLAYESSWDTNNIGFPCAFAIGTVPTRTRSKLSIPYALSFASRVWEASIFRVLCW